MCTKKNNQLTKYPYLRTTKKKPPPMRRFLSNLSLRIFFMLSTTLLHFSINLCAQNQEQVFISLIKQEKHKENLCVSSEGHVLCITKLQFYMAFSSKEIPEESEYYLPDLSQGSDTLKVSLTESSRCFIGIDSLTQKDGARAGALDPFNGMYWAWHSGYIQLKLEGNIKLKDGGQQDIIIHAGGFSGGYNPLIELQTLGSQRTKSIELNLDPLISVISKNKLYRSMTQGENSKLLMQTFSHCFTIH